MDLPTINYYEPHAPEVARRYKRVDMSGVHRVLLAQLPEKCAVVDLYQHFPCHIVAPTVRE